LQNKVGLIFSNSIQTKSTFRNAIIVTYRNRYFGASQCLVSGEVRVHVKLKWVENPWIWTWTRPWL